MRVAQGSPSQMSASHAMDEELWTLFHAKVPASPTPVAMTVDAAAAQLPMEQSVPLMRALELRPQQSGEHYHRLAQLAQQYEAPPEAQAVLLERASALLPSDTALKFAQSNARKDHFFALHTAVKGSETRSDAALKEARKRWLASLRKVVALEEGRWSSTVNQNLGTALQLMGKVRRRGPPWQ